MFKLVAGIGYSRDKHLMLKTDFPSDIPESVAVCLGQLLDHDTHIQIRFPGGVTTRPWAKGPDASFREVLAHPGGADLKNTAVVISHHKGISPPSPSGSDTIVLYSPCEELRGPSLITPMAHLKTRGGEVAQEFDEYLALSPVIAHLGAEPVFPRLDFVSTHYFTNGKESVAHERCTKATMP